MIQTWCGEMLKKALFPQARCLFYFRRETATWVNIYLIFVSPAFLKVQDGLKLSLEKDNGGSKTAWCDLQNKHVRSSKYIIDMCARRRSSKFRCYIQPTIDSNFSILKSKYFTLKGLLSS